LQSKSTTRVIERGRQDHVQLSMKHNIFSLPLLLGATLIMGCASDLQSAGSGSGSGGSDPVTYTSNDSPSTPDTSAQDAIDRSNAQAASDASNAAAQAQFNAGMAAAQETMNNANTPSFQTN
jgi:hypothetical protein